MIDTLTPIWERVLQRKPIGVEDDFFDLGGDPAAANRLFAEIAQACGRELSPLTIYQAPTIAALATILEEPAQPRFPPLVQLRAGVEAPPIFMTHGIGGSVAELFQLVRHLETRHPVLGLQSRGLDGVEEPFDRVEDLAQYFLDAIRARQPRGPYIFIGYSFGGVVALEMARRLSEDGDRIALLVMVESYPHRSYVPIGQKASIAKRRVKRLASNALRRVRFESLVSEIPDKRAVDRPGVGEKFTPIIQRAAERAELMWRRFRPRHYKGKINFVSATEIEPQHPDDPSVAWRNLADEICVEKVPGHHYDVVSTHSKSLAAVISRYLKEISC